MAIRKTDGGTPGLATPMRPRLQQFGRACGTRVDKAKGGGHNETASKYRTCARMAELADAPGSGPGSRKGVEVRVLFRAPVSFLEPHAENAWENP